MKIDDLIPKKEKSNCLSKILILIILFLSLLITFKSNSSFKDKFYRYVFEDNISFSKINKVYEKYFGSPIPFDDLIETEPVFSEKISYKNIKEYKEGAELEVDNEYLVPSQLGGIVVFIGDKEGYGKTVVVQQYNGIDLWYGNLDNINVELYDYIEEGTLIGSAKSKLYLVYRKNGTKVDYNEYL